MALQTALDKIASKLGHSLISKFGASVLYTRVISPDVTSSTSEEEPVEENYSIHALIADYNLMESGAGFASGLIVAGDKEITISSGTIDFVPQAGDKIEYNDVTYTVVRVKTDYSGEQPAVYNVQGRV